MTKKIDKKKRQRKFIPRETRKFQLRLDHPTDVHVREVLEYSKGQRREVSMIRDGVRLMWSLGEGDLTVLFELFPSLRSQFAPNTDALIEEFRQMLLQRPAPIPEIPTLAPASSGLKKLAAPEIAMPTFDDEDTIVIKRDLNANTSVNFLDAALGFQKGKDA